MNSGLVDVGLGSEGIVLSSKVTEPTHLRRRGFVQFPFFTLEQQAGGFVICL